MKPQIAYSENILESLRNQAVQGLPKYLQSRQTNALNSMIANGLPSTRDEEWKYTSLRSLSEEPLVFKKPTGQISGAVKQIINSMRVPHTSALMFVDGRFIAELSDLQELRNQGLEIDTYETLLKNDPQKLEDASVEFATKFKSPHKDSFFNRSHPFRTLHEAALPDGLFINVPAGKVLEKPIQILHYQQKQTDVAMSLARSMIKLGKGAIAEIIETSASEENAAFFASLGSDILLGAESNLNHRVLLPASRLATNILLYRFVQDAKSILNSHFVALGSKLSRVDLDIIQIAEGAEATLDGLYIADSGQHVDMHTSIEHAVPRTSSRQLYKGIVREKGRAVFNGKVFVKRDAQETKAFQQNRNLLLGRDAEVNTKPQLEIDANDVQCSHGATVARLADEELFYLQSRAIPAAMAERILVQGFYLEILDKVGNKDYRDFLHLHIDRFFDG